MSKYPTPQKWMVIPIAKRQYSYVGPSSIIKAYKIDKNRASTDSRHERCPSSKNLADQTQAPQKSQTTPQNHLPQIGKKNSCSDEL
jgi:hypothetical protein